MSRELLAELAAFGRLHLDRHAALVAVDGEEVVAASARYVGLELLADVHVARRVAPLGLFDLDDLGAEIAEHHRAIGARDAVRQVEHLDAFEGSAHGRVPQHRSEMSSRCPEVDVGPTTEQTAEQRNL